MIKIFNSLVQDLSYLGIDPPVASFITGFSLLVLLLIFVLLIKTIINYYKVKKDVKRRKRDIDKRWIEVLGKKNL